MSIIIGVDEVGLGSVAGPVVAGAVAWHENLGRTSIQWGRKKKLIQLNDSKKLNASQRKVFNKFIKENANYGIGEVSVQKINEVNIHQAAMLAMQLAVEAVLNQIDQTYDEIIIDGQYLIPGIKFPQRAIVKADTMIPAVMAASIIAKVYRDNLMDELHIKYPKYCFNSNKGYQSKQHIEAIQKYGLTPIHRNFERFLSKIGVKYEIKVQN